MKPKPVLVGALAIGASAALAVPSVAAPGDGRVVGTALQTSKATVKTNTVVFQTSGVVLPASPTILPAGTTDPAYGRPVVCNGNVTVTVYRGGKRLNRKTVPLTPQCTFTTSNTVSRKKAFGKTFVRVAFLGGTDVVADTAPASSFSVRKKKRS